MSRGEILRGHYLRLLRKTAIWAGLGALLATTMVAQPANAAQLTSRSTTVSTSAGNASGVTYATRFTFGTNAGTIGSIKIEICDSPLPSVACANATGSAGANFTSTSTGSVAVNSGTWANSGSCVLDNPNSVGNVAFVDCTVGAYLVTPTVTLTLNNVQNPTAVNSQYYLRITTYEDQAATQPAAAGRDYGAVALSTTQTLTVAANVQESLAFCTGTAGGGSSNCSTISGTAVNIGTGTDNVLSSTAPSAGTAKMYITTNAGSGYSITYITSSAHASGGFARDASTVFGNASNQTFAACTSGGVSCFGLNIMDNATPNFGTTLTGDAGFVSPTINSGYGTADTFTAVPGATAQQVASTTAPTVKTDYTVTYAAQAGTATPSGSYSLTTTWIATGTF